MSRDWIVGIDGCPGGWVAVGCPECSAPAQSVRAVVASDLARVLSVFGDIRLAGIDMPIGLSDDAPRDCDRMARERLGARRSSVFAAPLRPALAATTHAEASSLSRQANGKGISAQAWQLFRRVREVDSLLGEDATRREQLVEVHPELSFLAMNAGKPLPASKHRIDGIYRRRALVTDAFGAAVIESVVTHLAGSRVKEDDMLDAFAVFWSTQRRVGGRAECLPANPPLDASGLPMRIVY
ncbi:MAG: DUF429 domain-containing protein [Halothiobacillaceae bacterium]|nr:DUF429 domain-containing protein [Halothiobacillaceae bacterium]